ncbi:MAG: hypothetical protein BWY63_03924 [Chloroflexi bacterium ADurb.Bin360]|nr:MAG: hypothetical protein BWY63_03924 [Chloroflexi bacterium ADurb.Bin360]
MDACRLEVLHGAQGFLESTRMPHHRIVRRCIASFQAHLCGVQSCRRQLRHVSCIATADTVGDQVRAHVTPARVGDKLGQIGAQGRFAPREGNHRHTGLIYNLINDALDLVSAHLRCLASSIGGAGITEETTVLAAIGQRNFRNHRQFTLVSAKTGALNGRSITGAILQQRLQRAQQCFHIGSNTLFRRLIAHCEPRNHRRDIHGRRAIERVEHLRGSSVEILHAIRAQNQHTVFGAHKDQIARRCDKGGCGVKKTLVHQ